MSKIVMYTTKWCPFCVLAKRLLDRKRVPVEEVAIDADPARRAEMVERSGRHTVPQIFIDGRHVGGFREMAALDNKGELDPLLANNPRSA